MSAFEGTEYGVGDFVLLENINIEELMKNLQLRFAVLLNFHFKLTNRNIFNIFDQIRKE